MKFKVTKTYVASVIVEADTEKDALAIADAMKAAGMCLRIQDDVYAGSKVEKAPDDAEALTFVLIGEEAAPKQ